MPQPKQPTVKKTISSSAARRDQIIFLAAVAQAGSTLGVLADWEKVRDDLNTLIAEEGYGPNPSDR